MIVFLVVIALLAVSVSAIYLLLKSMGEDGVEIAAPGSCKRGRCGVQHRTTTETSCRQEEDPFGETAEIERKDSFQLSDRS